MRFKYEMRFLGETVVVDASIIDWLRLKIGWLVWETIERPVRDKLHRKVLTHGH